MSPRKVQFTCGIEGRAYYKHGTNIETRLTVFDKIPAANPRKFNHSFAERLSLSDLLQYVREFVPPRLNLIKDTTVSPPMAHREADLFEIALAVNQRNER